MYKMASCKISENFFQYWNNFGRVSTCCNFFASRAYITTLLTLIGRGADLCWALGGIISNFTPILPYFQHWGDEPRPRFCSGEQIKWRSKKRSSPKMEHFFPQIQVKTKKKKVFTKNGKLFSPEFKWTPTLRCTPESNYWGGCRCKPYLNYWGDTVKLLGGYTTHPPRFRHPC